MYASDCVHGQVISYYGELYQVCGRPNNGFVPVVKENGMIGSINYYDCSVFTRFKDLIDDGKGDCLKWFVIPKSWLDRNDIPNSWLSRND